MLFSRVLVGTLGITLLLLFGLSVRASPLSPGTVVTIDPPYLLWKGKLLSIYPFLKFFLETCVITKHLVSIAPLQILLPQAHIHLPRPLSLQK